LIPRVFVRRSFPSIPRKKYCQTHKYLDFLNEILVCSVSIDASGPRSLRTMLVKFKRNVLSRIGAACMAIFLCISLFRFNSQMSDEEHIDDFKRDKRQILDIIEEPAEIPYTKDCPLKLLQDSTEFMNYFKKLEGVCVDWRAYGKGDGLKYICMDPVFNIKPGNCNVLSFGINNEWSFDDEMDKFGCKVYAFDPTMKKEDHNRSENIQFFKLGIGSIDGKQKVGMDNSWSMERVNRYETILKNLRLTDVPIDYVKMDVEYSEIDFLADMFISSPQLFKNIKQIGMEVHHGYDDKGLGHNSFFQMFWLAFQLLKCQGFKVIYIRPNGPWHEVVWGLYKDWS
ncbi:hypothetical protein SK128_006595, partial [Halocaridina rubra]